MGEWIGIITIIILIGAPLFCFKKRVGSALIFGILFFACLAPWYIRNYQYTHKLFFNPTIGTYLNCFSVPKILRRIHTIPLKQALSTAQQNAAMLINQTRGLLESQGLFVSNEECKKYALPILMNYPGYMLYDWTVQCLKTTFDLYSCQLVALVHREHTWDPLEEFLDEKVGAALWCRPMPLSLRLLAWLELLWMIIVWIGLLHSCWLILSSLLLKRKIDPLFVRLWLFAVVLSLFTIGLTGGFGYARLRLPIEPLLIIFGLLGVREIARKR